MKLKMIKGAVTRMVIKTNDINNGKNTIFSSDTNNTSNIIIDLNKLLPSGYNVGGSKFSVKIESFIHPFIGQQNIGININNVGFNVFSTSGNNFTFYVNTNGPCLSEIPVNIDFTGTNRISISLYNDNPTISYVNCQGNWELCLTLTKL